MNSNLGRETSGSVATLFGIAAAVIIAVAGLAIDFGRSINLKWRLDRAADSTALAAAKKASDLVANGAAVSEAHDQGLAHGQAIWSVNTQGLAEAPPHPSLELSRNGEAWSAKVTYASALPTKVLAVLGLSEMNVAGAAEATLEGGIAFVDFYLLLDTSQSMGLAATQAGSDRLVAMVGCQFGCHVTGESQYYDAAKASGIPMRIDILRDATDRLIGKAISTAKRSDQFRVGLWTYDRSLTTLSAASTDLRAQQVVSGLIHLPTYYDGTQTDDALRALEPQLSSSGSGSSPDSPMKFVFLVTDGVQDGFYTGWMPPMGLPTSVPGYGVGRESPVSPTACDGLKAKGMTVAILYTTYVRFAGWQYDDLIGPFETSIAPNLQACASPGFFFQATDASEIDAAMQAMFAMAVNVAGKLRLSQ